MPLRLSSELVLANTAIVKSCPVTITTSDTTNVPINIRKCTLTKRFGLSRPVSLYVDESSGVKISFDETDTDLDLGTLSGATFDVWDTSADGSSNQITKSLGSGIEIVNDSSLVVSLSSTDTDLPPTTYYFEFWVTLASSTPVRAKFGDFIVQNTRKYDS